MSNELGDIRDSLKRIEAATKDREDRLEAKIDKLTENIFEALQRIEAIEARAEERPCKIHDAFINGNGKPGAKERLANVEKAQGLTSKLVIGALLWIATQAGWMLWSRVIAPVPAPSKEGIHQLYEAQTPSAPADKTNAR